MSSSSIAPLPSSVGELPPYPPGYEDDPRLHFSRVSQTWQYEDDDGTEMEFDQVKRIWVPILDEELVRAQQAAYSIAGVNEDVSSSCYTSYTSHWLTYSRNLPRLWPIARPRSGKSKITHPTPTLKKAHRQNEQKRVPAAPSRKPQRIRLCSFPTCPLTRLPRKSLPVSADVAS